MGTIFAAEAEPAGGLIQLVLQGGAFALLAYWLVYDLPRSRREQAEERSAVSAARSEEWAAVSAAFERAVAEFRAEAREQREACDRHVGQLAAALDRLAERRAA